jgi:hypothetical protein
MKITWKPRTGETGSAVVLGDNTRNTRGPGSKLIVSSRPGFQAQAQVAAYPRAEIVETFSRGNIQTGIAITILYEFQNHGECTRFTFDLGNYLAIPGVLDITHTGGGSSVMEGVFTGADVAQQEGASALVNFTFTGGRFTKGQTTTNTVPAL